MQDREKKEEHREKNIGQEGRNGLERRTGLETDRQEDREVTILNLIINIYKPSIHSRTDHFITDSTMDRISKIHRCGTIRQILDISVWCKAVDILLKEIQVTLQQT